MKHNIFTLCLFSFFLILSGCSDSSMPKIEGDYLTSFHKIATVSAEGSENYFKVLGFDWQSLSPELKPIDIFKITYITPFLGKSVTASGLVAVPSDVSGDIHLVSFQHGTIVANNEAPSSGSDLLYYPLTRFASIGMAVILPDYIGFGSSSDIVHPYMDKESTVLSIINFINASKEFIEGYYSGAKIENSISLGGYSQGAWATLATTKYFDTQNSDFSVDYTTVGASPVDLTLVQRFGLSKVTYPQPYFFPYVFLSYINTNQIETSLNSVFQPQYAEIIPSLFETGTYTGSMINSFLTDTIVKLFTSDFLENHESATYNDVNQALTYNSVTTWPLNGKLVLYHSTGDTYISYENSKNLFDQFESLGMGDKVELITYNNYDHAEYAQLVIVDALEKLVANMNNN